MTEENKNSNSEAENISDIKKEENASPKVDSASETEKHLPEEEESDNDSGYSEEDDDDFDSVGTKLSSHSYSPEERKKLMAMYEDTITTISQGEVLQGKVMAINNKEVVLNLASKSDGLVPVSEFRDMPDLKVGDMVEVFVENQEDKNGQLILSRKRAKAQKSWEMINDALTNDHIITGYVKSRTKGGLIVDIDGVEAFLPGSQIGIKLIRDYDAYVGKTMEFKVVKINHDFKNVVVSHKALIEDDLESQKMDIISKLEKGQVLEGTVKNITKFGAFIDLGGVDGLLYITDISWERISHPSDKIQLDQKLNVVVLDFDDDKKRIALGLKQLTPHPWDSLDPNLVVGSKVKGRVVTIFDSVAFMEIIPGVEGLIHISEMSWSRYLRNPKDLLKIDQEIEAVILTIEREDRKMSLSIKRLAPDPWANIKDKYPINSRTTAVVRNNTTNFGLFAEVGEGIDGLVPMSEFSWFKKYKNPQEFAEIGDNIEVVVLGIDEEERKLTLGHKQVEENPWDTFETVFTLNSVHQGTIIKITDRGAMALLPYGVEGFIPSRHMVKEDGTVLNLDETVELQVIEFSKETKRILLSHTRIWEDKKHKEKQVDRDAKKKDAKDQAKVIKKMKDSAEKSTLGDLSALAELKQKMEKGNNNQSESETEE